MERNTREAQEIERAAQELFGLITGIETPEDARQFLQEVLTNSELEDLALRWLLMKKIHEGVPQRRIAAELHISLCKITRGSKILKNRSSYCSRALRERE